MNKFEWSSNIYWLGGDYGHRPFPPVHLRNGVLCVLQNDATAPEHIISH